MIDRQLTTFFAIAAMVLSIWVIRRFRRYLTRRSASKPLGFPIALTELFELLIWISGVLATLISTFHPVSLLVLTLFLVSMITNSVLRYREDRGTLNRCLKIALQQGTPLTLALEQIGNTLRSGLAERVYRCVRKLRQGHDEYSSITRSHLPIDAEIIALVSDEFHSQNTVNDAGFFRVWSTDHFERDLWKLKSQISHQLLYIAFLMVFCCCLGIWVNSVALPLIEDFSDGIDLAQRDLIFSANIAKLSTIVITITSLYCGWLLSILLIPKLPYVLVRLIPWLGRTHIDQQRACVLRSLARGTKSGLADYEILKAAGESSKVGWIASDCRKSMARLDAGYTFDQAIQRSILVRSSERDWLVSCSDPSTLPVALDSLASSIQRGLIYRWQLRMTWLVPLFLVISGIYIFATAGMTFGLLRDLILSLA